MTTIKHRSIQCNADEQAAIKYSFDDGETIVLAYNTQDARDAYRDAKERAEQAKELTAELL